METEEGQGARQAGTECWWAPPEGSTFIGLWESSNPLPLRVGPRLLELDGLLRQERLLVVWGSAEQGEGVAVAESGEDTTDCSDFSGFVAPWRPGWILLIFSEDPPWLL